MRIIPAIDIMDGKCVRLTQGNYDSKKIYRANPLDVAMEFADHGIAYLHVVDLDGAKAGKVVNWKVLENIAGKTGLHIDFGGGIKSDDDLNIAFDSGANQITAGSIAVADRERVVSWLQRYGSKKIILGADTRDGRIAVGGWVETSDKELEEFIESYMESGIEYSICTDISKDGMMEGPAFELYARLKKSFPELKLIASGGIRDLDDLDNLAEMNMEGAIVGKAIYEGAISLKELEKRC